MDTNNDRKERILVVEDEGSLLNAMQDQLGKEGFLIYGAKDGEDGLKQALEKRPDLIILDILMPKMSGMDVLKQLREGTEFGKQVKVIFLTNLDANDKMIAHIVETQPSYYLIKADMTI